jgi:hypothetical protein
VVVVVSKPAAQPPPQHGRLPMAKQHQGRSMGLITTGGPFQRVPQTLQEVAVVLAAWGPLAAGGF